MITNLQTRAVWVYRKPIDCRKQLNGLIQTVKDESDGGFDRKAIYLFQNRHRDKIKLITWDRNGFLMGYKRLERGKFDFPTETDIVQINTDTLLELMAGMPMVYVKNQTVSSIQYS